MIELHVHPTAVTTIPGPVLASLPSLPLHRSTLAADVGFITAGESIARGCSYLYPTLPRG